MTFKTLICIFLLTLSVSACNTTIPLQPIYTDPINYKLSSSQMQQAILEAGMGRGWLMTPTKTGEISAELNIRTHKLTTLVKYDANSFSVNYVNSVNLNAEDGKIHRQYANWVNNLRQDIKIKMNMASINNTGTQP